jgi:SecD/SecF fusion protein
VLTGGEVMRGFALAIIFGIVIGTSLSIFIASPILLFLGEKRLRLAAIRAPQTNSSVAGPIGLLALTTQAMRQNEESS